jgi:hypothetical protein
VFTAACNARTSCSGYEPEAPYSLAFRRLADQTQAGIAPTRGGCQARRRFLPRRIQRIGHRVRRLTTRDFSGVAGRSLRIRVSRCRARPGLCWRGRPFLLSVRSVPVLLPARRRTRLSLRGAAPLHHAYIQCMYAADIPRRSNRGQTERYQTALVPVAKQLRWTDQLWQSSSRRR